MYKENVEFLLEPIVNSMIPGVRVVIYEHDVDSNERSIRDIMEMNTPRAFIREIIDIAENPRYDEVLFVGDYDFGRARTFKSKFEKAFAQTLIESQERIAERG